MKPSPIGNLSYLCRSMLMRPRRYRNLFKIIHDRKCASILEIGVYNGTRACQMIETAKLFQDADNVEYFGFDLFELLTQEVLEKELSKQPPPMSVVEQKIKTTGAKVSLYRGYTTDTLPGFVKDHEGRRTFDFIFIDGGHSLESIQFDWNEMSRLMGPETVVVFDDYYRNDEPETKGFGCQSIIDGLDRETYVAEVMAPEDSFPKDWGRLNVSMAKVQLMR